MEVVHPSRETREALSAHPWIFTLPPLACCSARPAAAPIAALVTSSLLMNVSATGALSVATDVRLAAGGLAARASEIPIFFEGCVGYRGLLGGQPDALVGASRLGGTSRPYSSDGGMT